MKIFIMILTLAALLPALAVAEEEDDKAAKLAEHKKEFLAHIESRIEMLNKAKDCANAAADRQALHSCKQQLKEDRFALKKEWKSHRGHK